MVEFFALQMKMKRRIRIQSYQIVRNDGRVGVKTSKQKWL